MSAVTAEIRTINNESGKEIGTKVTANISDFNSTFTSRQVQIVFNV